MAIFKLLFLSWENQNALNFTFLLYNRKYYIHENDLVKDHVHNFVVIEKKKEYPSWIF